MPMPTTDDYLALMRKFISEGKLENAKTVSKWIENRLRKEGN
jgi:hypothetical protein